MKKAARSLCIIIWVIIRSEFFKNQVIIWVIIMTKPRSVFLFWAVVTLLLVQGITRVEIRGRDSFNRNMCTLQLGGPCVNLAPWEQPKLLVSYSCINRFNFSIIMTIYIISKCALSGLLSFRQSNFIIKILLADFK